MTPRLLCPPDVVEHFGGPEQCSVRKAFRIMREAGAIPFGESLRLEPEHLAAWERSPKAEIDANAKQRELYSRQSGLDELCVAFASVAEAPYPGTVYFARDLSIGAIKIGFTRDPARRIYKLRLGNPMGVEYEALLYGTPQLEARCHEFFWPEKIRGEWFKRKGMLARFLKRITVAAPALPVAAE